MNGETKLHESIMDMLTMLGAEDPLPAARVLEAAVKEAIEEGIEKLKAELVARLYPANEPQPEPPAPPAFAVGTRVRLKEASHEFEAGAEGEVVRFHRFDKAVAYVHIDGSHLDGFPFSIYELEPLPSDPGAPAGALPAGVTVNDEFTIYDDNDVGTAITFTITETMLEIVPDSADMETSIDIERAIKLHTFLGRAIETMKANAIAYKREQQAREMNEFKGKFGGDDGLH